MIFRLSSIPLFKSFSAVEVYMCMVDMFLFKVEIPRSAIIAEQPTKIKSER